MKTCTKCGQKKHLSEFYYSRLTADGHVCRCMNCMRKYALEYRKQNIDRIRKYDRDRGMLPHRRIFHNSIAKKYKDRFPNKTNAWNILKEAIRINKINKPNECSMCNKNNINIIGHHKDYDKPLDVIWVCEICHKELHKNINKETHAPQHMENI
jgi:hypothetical protein